MYTGCRLVFTIEVLSPDRTRLLYVKPELLTGKFSEMKGEG